MHPPEPPRILIVDDARENVDILTGALEEYKKSIALNGERALKIAASDQPPDLILLDILMPGMDGFEVCRRLKEDPATQSIPVIFLTGSTDSESVVKGFELGAVDYVTKPFNVSELLARVHTQLALKRSREEIERYSQEIEYKNNLITDSIKYASMIQNAVLPKESFLSEMFDDFFVIYRPKDIVSGDFYWAMNTGEKAILIAADSTGHGVPGAFMSMFGVAFLNEIVGRDNITEPARIIDRLREMIIQSLGQDSGSDLRDGMDMSVISLDRANGELVFAGADNPMYLVREGELTQIACDRMPVSIYDRMDPFTSQKLDIRKGDCIYLFSDGFADQFGGPQKKKFKYKNLKELIVRESGKSMADQKAKLEKAFDEWKGPNEQVDDVLLIGIKIG